MTTQSLINFILFFILFLIPFGVVILLTFCLIRYFIFGKTYYKEIILINSISLAIDKYIKSIK